MYEKERAAMTCRIMQSHTSSELIITLQHIQRAQVKTVGRHVHRIGVSKTFSSKSAHVHVFFNKHQIMFMLIYN